MEFNQIYDPTKLYFGELKLKIKDESEKYFDNYIKESKIDVELNKKTAREYEEKLDNINALNKQINKFLTIKVLFIVLICALTLFRIIFLFVLIKQHNTSTLTNNTLIAFIVSYVLTLGITIYLIIYLSTKNRKRLSKFKNDSLKEKKEAEELLNMCNNQMKPLLDLFDYSDPDNVLQKVTPIIQVDNSFDVKKVGYLHEKFDFELENRDKSSSTIYSKSGSIEGNPFIIIKKLNTYMSSKTYTGSRIVSYTVTYRDSDGKIRTRIVTETLFASVTKPCPAYYKSERLYFGSTAAPNLSFSRTPFYHKNLEGKPYDRFIESEMKKIIKANKKNSSYTEMNNDEFEVLFHCDNRDDEIEYRLLFTPLGQQSVVNLIKNSPYGDDFSFHKHKKLNEINAIHALQSDRSCDVKNYYSYSIDKSRNQFVNYCCDYFKSIFFEIAPILAIPIYQQTKPFEYIYNKDIYPNNVSRYDHEVAANEFSSSVVDTGVTLTIRKTKYIESKKDWDIFEITSYGYKTLPRVDMIPKVAGNGQTFLVPVNWDEYIPVEKTTTAAVKLDEDKQKIKEERYYNENYRSIINRLSTNKSYKIARDKIIFTFNKYSKKDTNILNDTK